MAASALASSAIVIGAGIVGGRTAGRRFLRRSVVDGAQSCFVGAAGAVVFEQLVAADGHCPGRILFRFRRSLGAADALSRRICHGAPGGDVADQVV